MYIASYVLEYKCTNARVQFKFSFMSQLARGIAEYEFLLCYLRITWILEHMTLPKLRNRSAVERNMRYSVSQARFRDYLR